jgi:hypothetical protein
MIRKIWLESETGSVFEFNEANRTLVTNLSGFGINLLNGYISYNDNYKKYLENIPLTDISATLLFLNGYEGYGRFVEYLENNSELRLYFVTKSKKRYCRVNVRELTKSDISANSIISELKLEKTSMWLLDVMNSIELNNEVVGKVYPHTFPYLYNESYQGIVELNNKGYRPAPTIIQINGSVKNPQVLLYKDDILVSSLRVYIETDNEFHKVIIDSRENLQKIVKLENHLVTNIYDQQDFTKDTFLYLPVGITKVVFDPGKLSSATCNIMFVENYLSS